MGYMGANDAATATKVKEFWTAAKLTIPPPTWTNLIIGDANRYAESDINRVMRNEGFGNIASTQSDFASFQEIDATLTYYRLNHNDELYKEWMNRLYAWGRGHGCNSSRARSLPMQYTEDSVTGDVGYGRGAL